MRIPRYWAKARYEGKDSSGRTQAFSVFGWSFSSLQEAQAHGAARAKQIFERITSGQKPGHYDYHDRPIREEILQEVYDGEVSIAVITRNRYGALVLNCRNVLFVDVDFPRPRAAGLWEAVTLTFSRKRRMAQQHALAEETIEQTRQWAGRNPDRWFRLYRTREGLRLLFTDRLYDPTSEETTSLLEQLRADPLYVKLTQKQECFRARLTAKPWRCDCARPPSAFPWADQGAEDAFRQWEATYSAQDARFKVCELVQEFGQIADIETLRMIVDLHDQGSRVEADAALA